jgi:hypothetical protein
VSKPASSIVLKVMGRYRRNAQSRHRRAVRQMQIEAATARISGLIERIRMITTKSETPGGNLIASAKISQSQLPTRMKPHGAK